MLDTRPLEEFDAGHIPGARHVAKGKLENVAAMVVGKPHIAAYCRGAYCATLHDVLEHLHEKDIPVCRLEDGFAEWRVSGFPVTGEDSF